MGGVISVLCLFLLAPVLASVAPLFGSRDIFMAALLGAVLVVIAHRGHHAVAGLLFCLGAFINTIGFEVLNYSKRFTFGQGWLDSGIDLIVVVLGLFALSQAYFLLSGKDENIKPPETSGNLFKGLGEVFRMPKVVLPSAMFGVIMGIIPGVGQFIAQFFSYSLAQKLSKNVPQGVGFEYFRGLV